MGVDICGGYSGLLFGCLVYSLDARGARVALQHVGTVMPFVSDPASLCVVSDRRGARALRFAACGVYGGGSFVVSAVGARFEIVLTGIQARGAV